MFNTVEVDPSSLKEISVVCTTPSCENKDISIDILIVAGGNVMCGPCGEIIFEDSLVEGS
jgi:hypothetical protein